MEIKKLQKCEPQYPKKLSAIKIGAAAAAIGVVIGAGAMAGCGGPAIAGEMEYYPDLYEKHELELDGDVSMPSLPEDAVSNSDELALAGVEQYSPEDGVCEDNAADRPNAVDDSKI